MQMNQSNRTSRTQHEIDENLKRAYDDVINQKVPDRFTDLLAKLKEAEGGTSDSEPRGDDDEQ